MDIIYPPFITLQNLFTRLSIKIMKGWFSRHWIDTYTGMYFFRTTPPRLILVDEPKIERYGPTFNSHGSGEYVDDLNSAVDTFFSESDSKISFNPDDFFSIADIIQSEFEDYYKKIEVTTHVNQEGITIVRYKNLLIDGSYLQSEFINDNMLNEISSVFEQQKKCLERLISYTKDKLQNRKEIKTAETKFSKLKWNGNTNVLVDIFYRLTQEEKVNGKPYIETTPENLTEIIYSCFLDKNGKKLSKETIETYLKPGRREKRPTIDKQFDLDPSLNLQ